MRGIWLAASLAICGQLVAQDKAGAPEKDIKTRPWAIIARRHAMAAKVYPPPDRDHPYALLKEPVLHRIQDVQGSSKGSVFIWIEPTGRPAAICDVFLFENGPDQYFLNNEWHSLSASPLRAELPGRLLLNAAGPGVEWNPIPDGPEPADKPQERDRQIRRLAARFSGELVNRKAQRFPLRLLTTPLHRHDTVGSAASRGGALFALVQQTDPEILLLIEARKSGEEYRWEYAVAGFSDMDLYLSLDGHEVWNDAPAFSKNRGAHGGGAIRDVETAVELEAIKRETSK